MYVVDFIKNIVKKNNIGVFVWLILNLVIVTTLMAACFSDMVNGNMVLAYIIGILIYIASLAITLSPIGEMILRWRIGCRKVGYTDYTEQIMNIFNEVYAKSKKKNPELPNDIILYICDDYEPNAFAAGRRTVCITKGLLRYPDNQIKAVLGHEFGHLANKDTDIFLIIEVGNFVINILFFLYRITFKVISKFFSSVLAFATEEAGMVIANTIIEIFVDFLLMGLMRLWTNLGIVICMHSSRKQEFLADEYSYMLGYGKELCSFLMSDLSEKPKGLWAALAASHPDDAARVRRLQELMKNNTTGLVSGQL